MEIKETTESSFKEDMNTNKLVILDFYTQWCSSCKVFRPVLETLQNEFGNTIKILSIDAGENRKLARQYKVMSAPTLVFIKGDSILEIVNGLRIKQELVEIINKYI